MPKVGTMGPSTQWVDFSRSPTCACTTLLTYGNAEHDSGPAPCRTGARDECGHPRRAESPLVMNVFRPRGQSRDFHANVFPVGEKPGGPGHIINGQIGLDRNKDWFIQFYSITSTNNNCNDTALNLERDLLIALEEVEYIDRKDHNNVRLLDKDKKEVLSLKRSELETKE